MTGCSPAKHTYAKHKHTHAASSTGVLHIHTPGTPLVHNDGNLKPLLLTSGASLPQSMHSPPKRVLRACPAAHVASGFEDSFRVAGFTKGGTLNGNCCSQAVALLARVACNAAMQPGVLLLVGASPRRSASSQAENILGRAAAAFGLRSGVQRSTLSTQHACV